MFDYTQTAIKKVSDDIKKLVFATSLIIQILLIAYFGYAIYSGTGNLIANIVLSVLSVGYFVFFIVTRNMNSKDELAIKKIAARCVKYAKLAIQMMTLVGVLYGAAIAIEDIGAIDVVLIALSLVCWIIQVVLEAVVIYVETQIEYIRLAIKSDIEYIAKPVTVVGDAIKKITGKSVENTDEKKSKKKAKLDQLVAQMKSDRAKKRAEKKPFPKFHKVKNAEAATADQMIDKALVAEEISAKHEKDARLDATEETATK